MKPELDFAGAMRAIAASRKYRHVAPAVIERVVREAANSAGNNADLLDRAKRRLHQAFAAFVTDAELKRAGRILDELNRSEDVVASLETAARSLLSLHASTRERATGDADFYAALWRITGIPSTLLDLGCGFHPFALPWMGLSKSTRYVALDLDRRLLDLVGRFLARAGQPATTIACDLAAELPTGSADVALALKLLPTLERQGDGAALRFLDRVPARFVVVSFPTRSLGHHERGMDENYRRFFDSLLAARASHGWCAHAVPCDGELLQIVEKSSEIAATQNQ